MKVGGKILHVPGWHSFYHFAVYGMRRFLAATRLSIRIRDFMLPFPTYRATLFRLRRRAAAFYYMPIAATVANGSSETARRAPTRTTRRLAVASRWCTAATHAHRHRRAARAALRA